MPFSSAMVRAILEGRKTQTRRAIKPQPEAFVQATPDRHAAKHQEPYIDAYCSEKKTSENPRGMSSVWCWWTRDDRQGAEIARCPYGVPGDRLWVREAWRSRLDQDHLKPSELDPRWTHPTWVADFPDMRPSGCGGGVGRYRSSRFLPRRLSRITLEITDVRVQRVQEISDEDALAEGAERADTQDGVRFRCVSRCMVHSTPSGWFSCLWDSVRSGERLKRGEGWDANPFVWAITFRRIEPAADARVPA